MLKVISRDEAKQQGLTRYYTGIPCKRGHKSEREVSSGKCKLCRNENDKKRYHNNPEEREKRLNRNYKYAKSDKGHKTRRVWEKQWYQESIKDPIFRFNHSLESNFKRWFLLKGNKGVRLERIEEIVGINKNKFRDYISDKFIEDMRWDNYGSYWHLDHILPKSLFNSNRIKEVKICWNYRNLRPLKEKENLVKLNKLNINIINEAKKSGILDILLKSGMLKEEDNIFFKKLNNKDLIELKNILSLL